MLELLYRIFIGHNHTWEIIESLHRQDSSDGERGGIVKLLQCNECGKLKQFDID